MEIKVIGRLKGGPWDKRHDMSKRVYDPSGVSPSLIAGQGGGHEVKVLKKEGEGMNNLKVNDLFCGAGGVGLAFKNAGWDIAGAWDFDKHAVKSYRHNVGDHVQQADITQMSWKDMPFAHAWTFGSPCQSYSVAGKQLGMTFKCSECGYEELFKGESIIDRNTLCTECGGKSEPKDIRGLMFFEVMRLLKETNENKPDKTPLLIMLENVKGINKFLPVVEEEYRKRGYKMYYTLYNSKYWGVPQNRERYFVVGVHESIEKDFVFPTEQHEYIPRLNTILESEVDEKYYLDYEKCKTIIDQAREKLNLPDGDLKQIGNIPKEELNDNERQRRVYSTLGISPSVLARSDGAKILVEGDLDIKASKQIKKVYNPDGIAPCCDGCEGGHRQTKIVEPVLYNRKDGIIKKIQCSPTLSASDWRGLNQNQSKAAIVENYRVRKLTPREYARLQGFPESYEIVVSNTQAYKQFGNAVTVNVVQAIAERLRMFLLSL